MDLPPARRRLARRDVESSQEPRRRLRRPKDLSQSPERSEKTQNCDEESEELQGFQLVSEPLEPREQGATRVPGLALESLSPYSEEGAPALPVPVLSTSSSEELGNSSPESPVQQPDTPSEQAPAEAVIEILCEDPPEPLPQQQFLSPQPSAREGEGGDAKDTEETRSAAASPDSEVDSPQVLEPAQSSPVQWPGMATEILAKPVLSEPLKPLTAAAVKEERSLKRASPCCASFPCCTAHCPITFCLLVLLGSFALFGVCWREMVNIDVVTDTSVFLEADSRSNAIRAAYLQAYQEREPSARRLSPRRLMTGRMPPIDVQDMYKMHSLILYYRTDAQGGLLNPHIAEMIRSFELSVRDGPLYQKLCVEMTTLGLHGACDPGHSFVNAMFPSMSDPNITEAEDLRMYEQRLDGRGSTALDAKVVQKILMSKQAYKDLILPSGFEAGQTLTAVRSFYHFNILCCRIEDSAASRGRALELIAKEWNQFLSKELLPKLTKFNERQKLVELNFEGGGLATLQLWNTLQADCLLAIGSVSFIILYLTLHAGSPLLSCGSILLTILAIPSAYLASALLSGSNEITGVAFLSIFLIAGLGADVVLVFVTFWEVSKASCGTETAERVKFLYRNAGSACLATTFTTAASFFANLASVLRALREFGFFMGLCILGAYLYLLAGLPALLILNDKLSGCCSCRCACCRQRQGSDPKKQRICRRLGNCCLRRCLVAHSVSCLVFFILMVVGFAVWIVNEISVDAGVPQMFPANHNLNSVEAVSDLFVDPDERFSDDKIRVCNFAKHQKQAEFSGCTVHLCQVTLETPLTRIGLPPEEVENASESPHAECGCFPTAKPAKQCFRAAPLSTSTLRVTLRVVGELPKEALASWRGSEDFRQFALDAALEVNDWQAFPHIRNAIDQGFHMPGSILDPAFLKQEYWETGEQFSSGYNVLPSFAIPVKLPNSTEDVELCHAEEICYCGAAVCTYAGERLVDPVMPNASWDLVKIPVPETARRMTDMEQMTESRLPAPFVGGRRLFQGVDVAVVWGIAVADGSPLLGSRESSWSFNTAFRPESPFTQRTLLQTCQQAPQREELLVLRTVCWIQTFRDFAASKDIPFPVPSTLFRQSFAEFVDGRVLPNGYLAKEFMWLGEDFELKATFIQFFVNVNYMTASSAAILNLMQSWDEVIDQMNGNAPAELGEAWHTSQLWIRAEAESAIVSSTVVTMIVSVACGFGGALLFTHLDLLLSLMVVVAVAGVTICLAWFMTVFMGWPVGVLEVLGLIVFVGYSITYSLHIAHKYQQHCMQEEDEEETLQDRRRHAVVHALQNMAGPVMGSAATTLGSSFFLFFCQLVIFVKLATVLFAVTFFACVFAILALPSALLCMGPVGTACTQLLPWASKQFAREPSNTGAYATSSTKLTSSLARKIPKDEFSSSQKTEVFLSTTPSAFKTSWPVAIAPESFGRTGPTVQASRELFTGSISTSVF